MALAFLSVAVSLGQVWAVKHAIDVASHAVQGNIYWAVALMGGLILCDFALNISGIWIRNLLGIKAQNRMQQRMLDRILRSEWQGCVASGRLPYRDYSKYLERPGAFP